jgi:hypothetical protein
MSFAMEGLRTLVREKHARLSRFAEPFMHKNAIFLPRQAWDQHIGTSKTQKNECAVFSGRRGEGADRGRVQHLAGDAQGGRYDENALF